MLVSAIFVVTACIWTMAIPIGNFRGIPLELRVHALAADISDIESTTAVNSDSKLRADTFFQNGEAKFHFITFHSNNDEWLYLHATVKAGKLPIPAGTRGLMTVWVGDEAIRTEDDSVIRVESEIAPGEMISFRILLTSEEVTRIAGRKIQMGLMLGLDGDIKDVSPNYDFNAAIARAKNDNWINHASTGFAGGNGTESNPYLISTAEQLAFLAKSVNNGNTYKNKHIKVTQEIDLADKMWIPIGSSEKTPFSGDFNGGMMYIKSLIAIADDESPQGLFGVTNGGNIVDTGVIDVYVNGDDHVGAVVGKNLDSEIEHIFSHGYVIGRSNVGGLIGTNTGTLTRSKTYCAVVGFENVGGIVGSTQENSYIYGIYFEGNVSGLVNVGGIAGEVNGGTFSTFIFGGTISGHGIIAGRINGSARFEDISYNIPDDTISFAGAISPGLEPEFANCFYTLSSATTDLVSDSASREKRIDVNAETVSRITEKTINNIVENMTSGASIDPSITVDTSILYNNVYHEAVLLPNQTLLIETSITNGTTASINATLMIAVYNQGKMIDFKISAAQSVPGNNQSRSFNLSYVIPNSGVDEVKVFVWDTITMRPYAFPTELIAGSGNDFYGNDFNTAQVIDISRTINGRINTATDLDYFKFTVPAGAGDYIVAIQYSQALTGMLYNASQVMLNQNTVSTVQGVTYLKGSFSTGQTYYLKMSGSGIGNYTVNFYKPTEYSALSLDLRRDGTITNNTNYHRYTFTAPSAGTYIFTSVGNTEVKGICYNSTTSAPIIADTRDIASNVSFRITKTMSAGEMCSLVITPKAGTYSGAYSLYVERPLTISVN